jgi:hypothetical protein
MACPFTFQLTLREDNEFADWPAEFGAAMHQALKTWQNCPCKIMQNFLADALGSDRYRV